MTPSEINADLLEQSAKMLKQTIADFSDAELLARPCPEGNHANWQFGHLISSETFFLTVAGAPAPELPAGFADRYNKAASSVDDPTKLAKKDELVALFDKVRAASIQFARNLKVEDFGKTAPEQVQRFCPTLGHMAILPALHANMHIGQMQALRRKLNKPILF